jgi:uncharacterized protein
LLDLKTAQSWYPASDPVHGFDHVQRVYHMAERLARMEGADLEIVRAASLLHDAHGSLSTEPARLSHQHASAEFAAEILLAEGWPQERIHAVQHCIRAHRFRDESEQPQSLEAKILFDADKLDAIGATGVARVIAYSVQAGQIFYAPPSERFLSTGELEPGETHTSYHEYLFKLVKLRDRLHTPSARLIAETRHRFLVEFFQELAAESNGEI